MVVFWCVLGCFFQQRKTPRHGLLGALNKVPGDVLLSHGEAPHYHRRWRVSRLSSEWDQVVPRLCVRQANGWMRAACAAARHRSLESTVTGLRTQTGGDCCQGCASQDDTGET